MFLVQIVLHSAIALFMVERALRIWHIEEPAVRFRYRVTVIVLPALMFPLFQLITPGRGGFYFREDIAVFDAQRWLEISLWGKVALGGVFFAAIAVTSGLMFVQEMIPVIRHLLAKRHGHAARPAHGPSAGPETGGILAELSTASGMPAPPVYVSDDETPVIFTTGSRHPAIVLSRGLMETFDGEELKCALAHELAHIKRKTNLTTLLVFVFRLLMFYNPVSLITFRRAVQDDELICDDLTVSLTGRPDVLASTLRSFYFPVPQGRGIRLLREAVETRSHNLLLEERIRRLEENREIDRAPGWGRYALTVAAIAGICYFVV